MNNIAIPAEEWANRITSHWREIVSEIMEVGRLLEQSKTELGVKAWEKMCGDGLLPFSESTAYKLIAISKDSRLVAHVRLLPPHWGTLNELTKLTDAQFEEAIDDGTIHPEMERKDISTRVKQAARAQKEHKLGGVQLALPDGKFGVILADPEWKFEVWSAKGLDRAADNHYPTSVLEVIKARDVSSIAADDCVLFLWATVPMLPHALSVMAAWGFDYRSHLIWDKDADGTGFWFRNRHELLLVGVKGQPPAPAPGTQFSSLQQMPRGAHSAKPEIFLEIIEAYFPTLPKIELNRRGPARPGWKAWGNEAEERDDVRTVSRSASGANPGPA